MVATPDSPVVTLTDSEAEYAATVAFRRQISNLRAGRPDVLGADPARGWDYHIRGALGEYAVAKWAGLPWDGALGDFAADDVAGLQVRTRARPADDLIIHPRDRRDRRFILVVPGPGVLAFRLAGWIIGADARQPAYWGDPYSTGRPAWWVPQDRLRAMPAPEIARANACTLTPEPL